MEPKTGQNFLRQQLLIEHGVQGSLLQRTALYSAACSIYFVVILAFSRSMANPHAALDDSLLHCLDDAIYWAPGLLFLIPLMAYDMLKLTNRFAGPVFRLRREMQRLVSGESERPLNFRDGDYWTDVADVFNELRSELIDLRQQKAKFEVQLAATRNTSHSSKLFEETEPVEDFLSKL